MPKARLAFYLGSSMLDEGSTAAEWISKGVVEEVAVVFDDLTWPGTATLSRSMKAGLVGDGRCSRSLVSIDTTRDIEGRNAAAA
jgi:hypothetical protein